MGGRHRRHKKKDRDDGQSLAVGAIHAGNAWPQFRGVGRDGRVAWLPRRLPHPQTDLVWKQKFDGTGVGGLTATPAMIVVSGRDATDTRDRFTALDPRSGQTLWAYEYAAPSELDYGNSPRATPTMVDGVVVTLGATGVLSGLDAQTGVALWSADVRRRFGAAVPTWGFSGSPLVVDGVIFLSLGEQAPLVAIDLFSGETRWRVAAAASAYASLMPIGENLIAGVGQGGYFLRQRDDGALVWSYTSEFAGDFGVPSPVVSGLGAIFSGENNGVLWFQDLPAQRAAQATAVDERLIPDTHTPVAVGDQLLVAYDGLHSLSLQDLSLIHI